MRAFVRSRLVPAFFAATLAACGSGSSSSDGSPDESGAKSAPDASSSSTPPSDGSPFVDGGAGLDAASGADTSIVSDGGIVPDGSIASDAGVASDGSAAADVTSSADSAPVADATSSHDSSSGAEASTDSGLSPFRGYGTGSACNDLITLGASWYYNWDTTPPCPTPAFVPMVWGHTGMEQTQTGITSEVAGLVSKGYDIVLGFNEPDNSTQSNITEADAIALWPAFNNPAVRLGSPATQANTSGQTWFKSFMSAVNADTTGTLRVDFIAAHWYGWNAGSCDAKAANLESYINYLEGIPGNRPIWLTEWGCLNDSNPDAATVQAFFSGAVTMFAKHPRIERYAWYPWETNNELVTSADALTSLGTTFAAEPAYK